MSAFAARHGRSNYVDQIAPAVDRCNRQAEAIAVPRGEAAVTKVLVRLVDRLVESEDLEGAKDCAVEGLAPLGRADVAKRSGLREQLRELAERQGDDPLVAGLSRRRVLP